jgi:hypothetical protein
MILFLVFLSVTRYHLIIIQSTGFHSELEIVVISASYIQLFTAESVF